jgi:hypothetical protein
MTWSVDVAPAFFLLAGRPTYIHVVTLFGENLATTMALASMFFRAN